MAPQSPITLDVACSLYPQASFKVRKAAANRKWQQANPEKRAEHQRRYRAKQSTKLKEKANRRKWVEGNRERHRANIRRWKEANPGKVARTQRNVALKKKYGITLAEFDALLTSQNNRCAICLEDQSGWKRSWMLDHCHETGAVRGILCIHCNRMVHSRATPRVLRLAADYVERFST